METRCPKCGKLSVIAQDIEGLCDAALLVKLENRIQLCCQQCGWMDFLDVDLEKRGNCAASHYNENAPPD